MHCSVFEFLHQVSSPGSPRLLFDPFDDPFSWFWAACDVELFPAPGSMSVDLAPRHLPRGRPTVFSLMDDPGVLRLGLYQPGLISAYGSLVMLLQHSISRQVLEAYARRWIGIRTSQSLFRLPVLLHARAASSTMHARGTDQLPLSCGL